MVRMLSAKVSPMGFTTMSAGPILRCPRDQSNADGGLLVKAWEA